MDHTYIEENGLIERYYQGLLPPEEEARFEEHFVGCPQCTEQLELARGFQRGVKSMVAEDAARAILVQAGLFAWLARRSRLAQWGLALAAVLILGLPAFWFASEGRSLRQTMAALQQRWQSRDRDANDLQQRLAESDANRRELESKLAQAKPSGISPGNLAVVLLTAVRGDAGEPAATIDLSRTGPVLALAVDPGPDSHFASYRVTLTKKGGATVFRQAGLQPNALEALMITFPATFFTAGEYRLRLEGVKLGGDAAEIGGYPFRVVGKRVGRPSLP
jgi:hypothetical protein